MSFRASGCSPRSRRPRHQLPALQRHRLHPRHRAHALHVLRTAEEAMKENTGAVHAQVPVGLVPLNEKGARSRNSKAASR